jgi:hypothetical protein
MQGELTMIRTALIAIAAIATIGSAAAQPAGPVRGLSVAPADQWAVIRMGQDQVSQCVVGLRSDAAAPAPGRPQFMIAGDSQFAILRVRASEWSFAGARDVAVTLTTADGAEQQPAAAVRGKDLIDIALGKGAGIGAFASSDHLDIRAEGANVRLPLKGLRDVLPDYLDCLAGLGKAPLHASLGPDGR